MKKFSLVRVGVLSGIVVASLAASSVMYSRKVDAQLSVNDWRNKVHASLLAKTATAQSEFLIYMSQRADLSGANTLTTKESKGRFVYERLTAAAAASQPSVTRTLDQLHVEYRSFWVANVIWAKEIWPSFRQWPIFRKLHTWPQVQSVALI
jgi:hypothetical protein